MVMAHIPGKTVMNIQAIGKMVRKMVMVLDISQTETNIREKFDTHYRKGIIWFALTTVSNTRKS